MTLPRYRLQLVLDSREKKKKDAERVLADARAELAKQQKLLEQREQDVLRAVEKKDAFSAEFMAKMEKGMETEKISQSKAYVEALKQAIVTARKKVDEQKKVIAQCEQKVQAAVAKVTEMTKEVKVIEKHKENWSQALQKEMEMSEEKEQEEVAQNLYQQARKRRQS